MSQADAARWRDLRDRLGDIAISTIDAFCLSLLREFPLEADVDPGFDLADDTEVPRLVDESLDQALRICRGARARRRRRGAGVRAARRAPAARPARGAAGSPARRAARRCGASSTRGPRDLTAAVACRAAAERLRDVVARRARRPRARSCATARRPARSSRCSPPTCARWRARPTPTRSTRGRGRRRSATLVDRLRAYFLTQEGKPRGERFAGTGFTADDCDSPRRVEAPPRRRRAAIAPGGRARPSARSAATSTSCCRAASGGSSPSRCGSTSARSTRTRCSTSPACSSAPSSC